MYAILKTGGKQYKVSEGDVITPVPPIISAFIAIPPIVFYIIIAYRGASGKAEALTGKFRVAIIKPSGYGGRGNGRFVFICFSMRSG